MGRNCSTVLRYHTRIVEPDKRRDLSRSGRLLAVGAVHGRSAPDAVDPARTMAMRSVVPSGRKVISGARRSWSRRTGSFPVRFSNTRSGPRAAQSTVTINADGTWSYEQDTVLIVPGQAEPIHHTDRNTLRKIGQPTPNPTAQAAAASLAIKNSSGSRPA